MHIVIGLGNPGEEYASTYHNVGRMLAEHIALKEGLTFKKTSHKRFSSAKRPNGDVLVIPETFMNESGHAAREAADFFDIPPEDMIVAHDDSDLVIGTYKFTRGGGSAGHHGIESLIASLGTPEFWRIRIGVRNPDEAMRAKAGEFVLKSVSRKDQETIYGVFDEIIANVIEK